MPTPKRPRSPQQIEASRKNGARSRGPVTPEGKANSVRNSLRHGALAKVMVLPGESRKRFHEVVDRITSALKPQTDMDDILIARMVAAHWRQIRLWDYERVGKKADSSLETRLDRQFVRNLNSYLRVQAAFTPKAGETNPTNI